jgi:hypothetical protein
MPDRQAEASAGGPSVTSLNAWYPGLWPERRRVTGEPRDLYASGDGMVLSASPFVANNRPCSRRTSPDLSG